MRAVDEHLRYFRKHGYPSAHPLASGMEGSVYRLRPGLIGKVWARRSAPGVAQLKAFYAELSAKRLPFRTPRIEDVVQDGNLTISIEHELPGVPLQDYSEDERRTQASVDCVIDVLQALGAIANVATATELPALDESEPLRGQLAWHEALARLAERRVARFGLQLRAAVDGFDEKFVRMLSALRSLPASSESVLHGDLARENILVDDKLRPTAVIDFGTLSTRGDPAFDAALAAAVFDMYGPQARAHEELMDRQVVRVFGYPPRRLLLYKASYAAITSNAYDPLGRDGHFAWCVRVLRRDDLTDMLRAGEGWT